jgi:hypothetical protein
MKKRYRDEIAMVTHDIMKDFQQAGAVTDTEMREFEKDCFVSNTDSARRIPEPQKTGVQARPIT